MVRINKEVKDIFTLSIGSFVAQLIPVLASLILARIYSAEQFGDKGVFLSCAAIIGVIVTGQYEMSIVRPEKENDAHALVRLCFLNVLFLSFITFCVILISDIMHLRYIESWPCKYLLPLYAFLLGISQIYMHYANRMERYGIIASSGVVRNMSQDSFRILLGMLKSVNGLIYGAFAGVLASVLYNERKTPLRSVLFGKYDWERIKKMGRRYRNFPMFLLPSSLLNNLSNNLPVVLLAGFFTKDYIGHFSMAISLLLLPVQLIGNAMGKVFYKRASNSDCKESLERMVFNLFRFSFFIGFILNVVLIPFGEKVFSFVLGENWAVSGMYAGILAPWILFTIVFSPLSVIFDAKDKQHIELSINALFFISRIVVVWIGGAVFKDMDVTVLMYSASGVLIWLLEGLIIFRLTRLRFSLKFGLIVLLSLSVILLMWAVRFLPVIKFDI